MRDTERRVRGGIVALIIPIFVSKEELKGSLGLLRSWKYYLAALVAPAIFVITIPFPPYTNLRAAL